VLTARWQYSLFIYLLNAT